MGPIMIKLYDLASPSRKKIALPSIYERSVRASYENLKSIFTDLTLHFAQLRLLQRDLFLPATGSAEFRENYLDVGLEEDNRQRIRQSGVLDGV